MHGTVLTATKSFQCDNCGKWVKKGEQYYEVFDDDEKFCRQCVDPVVEPAAAAA
jgi:hypothetical protein